MMTTMVTVTVVVVTIVVIYNDVVLNRAPETSGAYFFAWISKIGHEIFSSSGPSPEVSGPA